MNAFIFDVDGTLAETEELHRAAFNEAFATDGLDWRWDAARYKALLKVSGGKERLLHFMAADGIRAPEPADPFVRRLHAAKTRIYGEGVAAGRLPLRAGIEELIVEAKKRGVRLAIATTTTRENVDRLLEATIGHARDFEVFGCGDDVPAKKPAPDIYELVLARLGLDAARCLAFEDSANGLRAAKGAGLACVVTPALYTEDEDFSAADLVVPDLRDREAIFALLAR